MASPPILIIGAGVAGLYTALKLAPLPVMVVTARPLGKGGSSPWAQGGMAAAIGDGDSPEKHLQDTIIAGAGLVDPSAARVLVKGGQFAVDELTALGVAFDRNTDGHLLLGREAAHSDPRIVHATGDRAGAAIMEALIAAAQKAAHITLIERVIIEDLLTDDDGRVGGALAYIVEREQRELIKARMTILATGGLGGLYSVTTNPVRAQGHGLTFAARAGATIRDPEFVQFHPTALSVGKDPAPLATEAIRGAGAHLVNSKGTRFMFDIHEDGELAPRDIVARGVEAEITAGRGAFLDCRSSIGSRFAKQFPTVYEACQNHNINPHQDLIPIAPACHYHMGGVKTDLNGKSSLEGLWAIGEVASTGIHGANRLASNSLLEAIVFGARVAESVKASELPECDDALPLEDRLELPPKPANPVAAPGITNRYVKRSRTEPLTR